MNKNDADYLRDILHEIDDILAFTLEGEAAFLIDVKTQKAVIRSYEIIGEISKRLSDELRTTYNVVDWRRLMAFRDFLAHNYETIALRYIWDAVKDVINLRDLIASIETDLASDDKGS